MTMPSGIEQIVADLVAKGLAEAESKHTAEIADLKAQLDAAKAVANTVVSGVTTHLVPAHAGGPGLEIAPTWSFAEQVASRDS